MAGQYKKEALAHEGCENTVLVNALTVIIMTVSMSTATRNQIIVFSVYISLNNVHLILLKAEELQICSHEFGNPWTSVGFSRFP